MKSSILLFKNYHLVLINELLEVFLSAKIGSTSNLLWCHSKLKKCCESLNVTFRSSQVFCLAVGFVGWLSCWWVFHAVLVCLCRTRALFPFLASLRNTVSQALWGVLSCCCCVLRKVHPKFHFAIPPTSPLGPLFLPALPEIPACFSSISQLQSSNFFRCCLAVYSLFLIKYGRGN